MECAVLQSSGAEVCVPMLQALGTAFTPTAGGDVRHSAEPVGGDLGIPTIDGPLWDQYFFLGRGALDSRYRDSHSILRI